MKKLIVFVAILTLLMPFSVVLADDPPPVGAPGGTTGPTGSATGGTTGGPTGSTNQPGVVDTVGDVMTVIDNITNWMFTIFLAFAVIVIIYSAFLFLTAGGGDNVNKARKMLLYAVAAIAIAVLAKGIVNVVRSLIEVGT